MLPPIFVCRGVLASIVAAISPLPLLAGLILPLSLPNFAFALLPSAFALSSWRGTVAFAPLSDSAPIRRVSDIGPITFAAT